MATITLPDTLIERSNHLAAQMGVSLSDLYEAALTQYVRQAPAIAPTLREQFDAVYAKQDSHLDPLFVTMQVRSLPDPPTGEEW